MDYNTKSGIDKFFDGITGLALWASILCFTCFVIVIVIGIIDSLISYRAFFWIMIVLSVLCNIFCWIQVNKYSNIADKANKEINDKCRKTEIEFNRKYKQIEEDVRSREYKCRKESERVKSLIESSSPFVFSASLAADMEVWIYDKTAEYMRQKSRPAYTTAERVRELKEKTKEYIRKYKEILYKHEFLINTFPEIEAYFKNDEDLMSLKNISSYSNFEENRDVVRDFLSLEEWNKLSNSQRNQLALDRYIDGRNKSAWCIGRDYEMSCAYVLKEKGFIVEMNGIEKRLGDLGRDLIATRLIKKDLFGINKEKEVLVIQCKCWNKDRPIRENVIMQLLGTSIAYRLEHGNNIKVIPVLMIPNFTILSEEANKFAEILNIQIMRQDFVDFPRIKCNVNGVTKIYHLPFDQQYDRTQIKKDGEFLAFTVDEAEKKGFRRAFRHCYSKNNS